MKFVSKNGFFRCFEKYNGPEGFTMTGPSGNSFFYPKKHEWITGIFLHNLGILVIGGVGMGSIKTSDVEKMKLTGGGGLYDQGYNWEVIKNNSGEQL